MPFKSKAQMRLLFAKEPEVAKKFAEHTKLLMKGSFKNEFRQENASSVRVPSGFRQGSVRVPSGNYYTYMVIN